MIAGRFVRAESTGENGRSQRRLSSKSLKKRNVSKATVSRQAKPQATCLIHKDISGTAFDLLVVRLAIGFVLDAATSLRSAAGCLNLVLELEHGQQHAGPSHTTVQNLVVRLGLYELTRTKERADDWIWITDHTIKGGVTKCLVILGIRYKHYQQLAGPLQHRDMQTLALIPVDKSTGEIVPGQLDELAGRVGVPMGIVSDNGRI